VTDGKCEIVGSAPEMGPEEVRTVLGKDGILQANDKTIVLVEVPEWGGYVNVRVLSGTERDSFEAVTAKPTDDEELGDRVKRLENLRARLAVLAICDDDGNRLFKDCDAGALGAKSAAALDRVFGVACDLSGLTAKDVKELEGNSDGDRSASSGSG